MSKRGLKTKKVGRGRNDLCVCGSGIKYKNCCKLIYRPKTDEELAEEKRIGNLRRRALHNEQSDFLNFMNTMKTVGFNRFDKGMLK